MAICLCVRIIIYKLGLGLPNHFGFALAKNDREMNTHPQLTLILCARSSVCRNERSIMEYFIILPYGKAGQKASSGNESRRLVYKLLKWILSVNFVESQWKPSRRPFVCASHHSPFTPAIIVFVKVGELHANRLIVIYSQSGWLCCQQSVLRISTSRVFFSALHSMHIVASGKFMAKFDRYQPLSAIFEPFFSHRCKLESVFSNSKDMEIRLIFSLLGRMIISANRCR